MKEYVLLFRMDLISQEAQPTKEQMTLYMKQWTEWIHQISNNNQLADGGNHLSRQGRVLTSNKTILETIHISENNSVAGFIKVFAKNLDDATEIAKKCPILNGHNTSVEIRETAIPGK